MTETEDDLASANAKLAVLATLAGFVASPVAVGLLQLGAPWVLRLAFVVFLLGGVAAIRLPKTADTVLTKPAAAAPDGRPILGPPAPDTSAGRRGRGARSTSGLPPSNRERQARINVARERQRLGLPLYVPEVVLSLAAMSVIRGSVGFLTFFLAFALRHLHAVDVVVRFRAPGQCHRFPVRIAPRARAAQVSVRAAADPLLARAVRARRASSSLSWVHCGRRRCSRSRSALQPPPPSLRSTRSPSGTCRRHCWGAPLPASRHSCSWSGCCRALLAVAVGFSLQAGDVLIGVTCAVAAGFHVSMRRAVIQSRLVERQAGGPELPGAPLN